MKQSLLSSWCNVGRTLAMTVGSPSIDRRGTMLKHLAFLLLFLFAGIGQMWGQVASATAADGKEYVVAIYYNSKYYALPNNTNASTWPGTEVAVNGNGKVTTDNAPTWKLVAGSTSGQYYLTYKNGNSTYYLYKNGTSTSNYNIKGHTSDKNYWSFTAGTGANVGKYQVIAVDRGSNHTCLGSNNTSTFQVRGTSGYNIILLELAPAVAYTVTLMDDNSTRTEASPGAGVTLPSRDGCAGYTFAGWTKTWTSTQTSWTTTAPTIIPAGSYTPAADENLYPVYTKTEGGESTTATITASNFTNLGSNNYGSGAERTGTVGTISLGGHYITGNNSNIQCQANNANIYNKTAFPGKITKVELNQTGTVAFSLYVGSEQLMSSSETGTGQTPSGTKITDVTSANKMTWNVSGNNTFFDIKKGGSAGYISSIVVTYDPSTTSYISVPNCCEPLGSINGSFFVSNQ